MSARAVCTVALLAIAAPAVAQTPSDRDGPRVEIWAGISAAVSGPGGMLATSYSPPLLLDGDFVSHGGQTLTADASFAVGLAGGVNVFPAARFGFQILCDRARFDLAGANGPYTVALTYTSVQPPGNQPQLFNISQTTAWPETAGSLTQFTVAVNFAARIGRPDRVSAIVSGGPALYRVNGSIEPIGFTTFHLGGHSVLFEEDYRLAASLEPTYAFGFDAGIDLSAPLGRHAAVVVGYRYFGGPEINVAVTPTGFLNQDAITFAQPLEDVTARLAAQPMKVSPSGSRLFAGVTLTR